MFSRLSSLLTARRLAYGTIAIGGLAVGLSTDSPLRAVYSPLYCSASSFLLDRLHRDRHRTILASVYGNALVLDGGIGSPLVSFPALTNLVSVSVSDPERSNLHTLASPEATAKHGYSPNYLSLYRSDSLKFLQSQPANSYESIVAEFSLSKYPEPEALNAYLKEVERVLKPGGHFYFIDHCKPSNFGLSSLFQSLLSPLYSLFTLGRTLNSPILDALEKSPFDRLYVEQWPREIDRQNSRIGIQLVYSGSMSPIHEKEAEFAPVDGFAPIIAGIGEKNKAEQNLYLISGNVSDAEKAKQMMQKVLGFGVFK